MKWTRDLGHRLTLEIHLGLVEMFRWLPGVTDDSTRGNFDEVLRPRDSFTVGRHPCRRVGLRRSTPTPTLARILFLELFLRRSLLLRPRPPELLHGATVRGRNDLGRFRKGEPPGEPSVLSAQRKLRPPGITQNDLATGGPSSGLGSNCNRRSTNPRNLGHSFKPQPHRRCRRRRVRRRGPHQDLGDRRRRGRFPDPARA